LTAGRLLGEFPGRRRGRRIGPVYPAFGFRNNRRHRRTEACSKRHVNMTISLAFLAPSLVEAAAEGRLLHGIGVARLFDAPVAWLRQHQMLGLAY
jgi:hypothetical protein